MRIGFVTPYLTRVGWRRFHERTAPRAEPRDRETRVRVFGLEDSSAAEDLATWHPVPVEAFPVRGPRAFGYAPALGRALRRRRVDLVSLTRLWMYSSVAAQHSHKPCVVSPHGMLDPWALALSRWKKETRRRAFFKTRTCARRPASTRCANRRQIRFAPTACAIRFALFPTASTSPHRTTNRRRGPDRSRRMKRCCSISVGCIRRKGCRLCSGPGRAADPAWHLVIAGWDQARPRGRV